MKRKTNKLVLAAGVLSMVLSACLCVGSTYAWFNHSLGSENTIKIGTFRTVATAGLSEAKSSTPLSSADTIFSPGSYDLSVRGVGDTPGYALIFLEAATSDFRKDVYYTPQLNGGTGYTYRIVLHEPTAICVTPVWGRMEGDAPLEEDKIIWYGRPPVVEQPEEQAQSDAPDQTGGVTATPPTESAETVAPNDSTQTEQPTDGTQTTPTTDSTPSTTPTDSADTTTGGAGNVPSVGGADSTPTTGGTQTVTDAGNGDRTPSAGSEDTATASGSEQSSSVTGSTETAPATGGTQRTPATNGTQTSTTTGSTGGASASMPPAPGAEWTAATTDGADSVPATDGAASAPTTGIAPE